MTAEIVSVGNELMDGFTVDTHAATLSRILAECGIDCDHRQTVRDEFGEYVEALQVALARAEIVVTIGGLGPTGDDLTREAVAAALGEELVFDEAIESHLRQFFEDRKMTYTEAQRKQAMRPACAQFIDNPNGTAPGLLCEKKGKTVISMPGPKGEFVPMANGAVKDYLSKRAGGFVIASKTLRLCAIGESAAEAKIKHLMYAENPRVAPYAQPGEVHLRITSKAATREAALDLLAPTEAEIRSILGDHVFGADETTLEKAVLDLLSSQNATVCVAESITGGELGSRFTSVAGSGDSFLGGVISYAPEIKEEILGVSHFTLEQHTPVSDPVAREMAMGVRNRLHGTYGVALTGNAGPTSDEGGKPVGLVYIAVAGPNGTECEEHKFHGTREDVRRRSTQAALVMLRRILLKK